ncbi:MAG: hypothetical protein HQL52_03940 [Magnetococcales bacterium]|nr:hypothetical protein [Magnetococcales bacterium]
MSNAYAKLKSLFPKTRLVVGTVDAHNADGTSTLTDASSREFTAQGTSVSVGNKAFVQDGRITGEAPSLPASTEYV